jgi:hypothetical protein
MKKIHLSNTKIIIISFFSIFLLSSCANQYVDATVIEPYGFFYGIWHGICLPFALIGFVLSWFLSLFDILVFENLKFVGKPNTGTSYFVGYVIGLLGILSSN